MLGSGGEVLEWAIFYLNNKLSIIPLIEKDKKPAIVWKEFQKRRPSKEEIKKWFSANNYNIAIICGSVSGNLVVLDFDTTEAFQQFIENIPQDLAEKIKRTWVVETGKGIHLYFRVSSKPKSKSFRDIGVDVQGEGKYVVAPPSVHPTGKTYRFKTDPKENGIEILSDAEFENILKILEKMRKKKSEEETIAMDELVDLEEKEEKKDEKDSKAQEDKEIRRLTDEQKLKLVKLLLPYWTEGRRHFLALMIAGALYWNDYPLEDALKLVKEICEKAKDEELKDRLRAVEDTYKRADKHKIAYKTWLQEAGITREEYEKLVVSLLEIIKGSFIVGNARLFVRKSRRIILMVDYKNAVVKELVCVKDSEGNSELVHSDTILTAVPEKVTLIYSEDSELLKITFRTRYGAYLRFEGDIEEIVNQLRKTTRASSRTKLADALSLIIDKMIEIGWCELLKGESVCGIVLDGNKLVAIDYDVGDTFPDPAELREALELLDKFVLMSSFSQDRLRKISVLVKWFIVSGLGWVYKQMGTWIPHCYLYGESDTGKTASARFLSNIWKEYPSLSLGSIDSPYRLGLALGQTTFPVVINEMDFDELDSDVLEMWKNAVDGMIVRVRYGRKVKAYGIFCFTSNSSIPINKAVQKRLLIIHFDPKDAETLIKQKEEFEKLERERGKLSVIGKFVFHYMKNNLNLIRELPWMDLAEMILTKAYEWSGLETPAWVKMRDYQDDEDVKTAKAEDIRAVIFERIAKEFEKIRYNFEYGNEIDKLTAYVIFKELSRRIPWIHARERERDIVLLRPLISVLKDEGVKVSSLRDLTYFIPKSQYRAQIWIRGTKMSGVIVDPLEFAKWLGVISVSEEGEGDKEGEGEDKDWDLEDVLE